MKLKQIDFNGVESVRKKCVTFAKDGNRMVKPYKTVYSMERITHDPRHRNVYIETCMNDLEYRLRLWDCLENFCISIGYVSGENTIEEVAQIINGLQYLGIEGFLNHVREKKESGKYIKKTEIEACRMLGKADYAQEYENYMEAYKKRLEEEWNKEEKEREELEERRKAEHRKEMESKFAKAEEAIKKRQVLMNVPMENSTLILQLMKRYGIKIPLKTQGWINKALARIFFDENGKITYCYYKGSKDSAVFW